MGVLLSRFRRQPTTLEVLEGIDKEINRLQKNRKVNQDRQKQFVTSLLIYSIAVYVIAAIIFFCVYFPDTWQLRFLYSLPLLIFPFLIWGIKKSLHWYFVKRITSNDIALRELRERKKQILDDVMETETYKRAREILEKFDPVRLRKLELGSPEAGTHVTITGTPGTVIQQRTVRTMQQVRGTPSPQTRLQGPSFTPRPMIPATRPRQLLTPYPPLQAPQPQIRAVSQPTHYPALQNPPQTQGNMAAQPRAAFPPQAVMRGGFGGGGYVVPPGPPMPRSVLPRERGTMDRLMDYLVGDGPENRYALICQQCYSHNGMALSEEYEYLSFRCCYCYSLNPAKKQRPVAPRLEFFAPPGNRAKQEKGPAVSNDESDDDDVDKEDEDYSDQESLESDTSAGISPISSTVSPSVSASARSDSQQSVKTQGTTKISSQSEPGGTKQDVKGSNTTVSLGSRPTERQSSNVSESQSAGVSRSRLPRLAGAQESSSSGGQVLKVQGSQGPGAVGGQILSARSDQKIPGTPTPKVQGGQSSESVGQDTITQADHPPKAAVGEVPKRVTDARSEVEIKASSQSHTSKPSGNETPDQPQVIHISKLMAPTSVVKSAPTSGIKDRPSSQTESLHSAVSEAESKPPSAKMDGHTKDVEGDSKKNDRISEEKSKCES